MKLNVMIGSLMGLAVLAATVGAQSPPVTNQSPAVATHPAMVPPPPPLVPPTTTPALPSPARPVPGVRLPSASAVPDVSAARSPSLRFTVPDPDRKLEWPISFPGTPIQGVLEYYAQLTSRSIIQSPTVTGTIVYQSQPGLTVREAIQALDSVLAINGVAVVPLGDKFLKVVLIATAKQEGLPIVPEAGLLLPADSLLTQIIALQSADAQEVVAALQPYMHTYGQLMPLTKSNSILLTDTAANIRQMMQIVSYIDRPSQLRMETRVYVLKNARAAEIVQQLQSIIQETQQLGAATTMPSGQPGQPRVLPRTLTRSPGQAGVTASGEGGSFIEGRVIITSDERTNKIFVLSRPSNFVFFEKLIDELDGRVEPDVITRVIELDYAQAEDMASLLNSLISGSALPARRTTTGTATTTSRAGQPPPPPLPGAVAAGAAGEASGLLEFASGVRIIPDQRTNSLLVMATHADMERLAGLIQSMDTAVAQVVIEVVIAEVNLQGTLEIGVDVFKRLFQEGQVQSGGGTANTGTSPVDLSSTALPLASALGSGGLTYFMTFQNTKLDAVVRLLATSSRFKVLSTPILQTQHNQQADIIVGESRPVVTSTMANISGAVVNGQVGTAVNSNVEYKDIAIEMKVTPRINPDGYVTMDIEQKINDLAGNVSVNGIDVPIITKREARATVSVRDKHVIVLGGLIKEDKTVTETKVPFLGDIPGLGHLFKDKKDAKNRTELIVFIRPTVMRNEAETTAEAQRRIKLLKVGSELGLEKMFKGEASRANGDITIKEMEKDRKKDEEREKKQLEQERKKEDPPQSAPQQETPPQP